MIFVVAGLAIWRGGASTSVNDSSGKPGCLVRRRARKWADRSRVANSPNSEAAGQQPAHSRPLSTPGTEMAATGQLRTGSFRETEARSMPLPIDILGRPLPTNSKSCADTRVSGIPQIGREKHPTTRLWNQNASRGRAAMCSCGPLKWTTKPRVTGAPTGASPNSAAICYKW